MVLSLTPDSPAHRTCLRMHRRIFPELTFELLCYICIILLFTGVHGGISQGISRHPAGLVLMELT